MCTRNIESWIMEDKTIKGNVRQIPYGMMNFVAIREDNYYYVDKTRFIEKVEKSNRFFFFIRPRRFGKSLTMSVLHHYYDILDYIYQHQVLEFLSLKRYLIYSPHGFQ